MRRRHFALAQHTTPEIPTVTLIRTSRQAVITTPTGSSAHIPTRRQRMQVRSSHPSKETCTAALSNTPSAAVQPNHSPHEQRLTHPLLFLAFPPPSVLQISSEAAAPLPAPPMSPPRDVATQRQISILEAADRTVCSIPLPTTMTALYASPTADIINSHHPAASRTSSWRLSWRR